MFPTGFKGVGLHYTAFANAIREDSRQTAPSRGVSPRKKFADKANVESRASHPFLHGPLLLRSVHFPLRARKRTRTGMTREQIARRIEIRSRAHFTPRAIAEQVAHHPKPHPKSSAVPSRLASRASRSERPSSDRQLIEPNAPRVSARRSRNPQDIWQSQLRYKCNPETRKAEHTTRALAKCEMVQDPY